METVEARQEKDKQALLAAFAEIPIVQIACKRTGIGRATYYRWREDKEFRRQADEALAEGEALITDMSESRLISLIKEGKFPAVHLWLRHHHQKYKDKIEVISRSADSDTLSPEQEAVVQKALRMVKLNVPETSHAKP